MLQNIGVLQGITAKMEWLNQLHTVIANNIANADTPGYRPHDLKPVDFAAMMDQSRIGGTLTPVSTDTDHMGGRIGERRNKEQDQRTVYEAAPSGNSVILEEQLMKSQTVMLDYQLMTNLYRKNVGMFKTALGKA